MQITAIVEKYGDVRFSLSFAYSITDEETRAFSEVGMPYKVTVDDVAQWLITKGETVDIARVIREWGSGNQYNSGRTITYTSGRGSFACSATQFIENNFHFTSKMLEADYQKEFCDWVLNFKFAKLQAVTKDSIRRRITATIEYVPKSEERVKESEITSVLKVRYPAMLIVPNKGVYRMELHKTQWDSLDDVLAHAEDGVKKCYNSIANAQKRALVEQLDGVRAQMEKQRADAFLMGLKAFSEFDGEWTIKDGYAYYPSKIVATKLKKEEVVYDLATDIYYVQGICVPLDGKIQNFTPWAKTARHTNVGQSEGGKKAICIGTLEGEPLIDVLRRLPSMMTMLNLDSALNGEIAEEIEQSFDSIVKGKGRSRSRRTEVQGWTA